MVVRFRALLMIVICFGTAGVTGRAWLAKRAALFAPGTVTPAKAGLVPPAGKPAANQIKAEVIALRPHGFEPVQLTRRKGQFLLVVLNRSGVWEANYQLDRLAGNRLHEAKVPREKLDWHQVVDLTPGDYVLKETNHPGWICKITVTPQ